MRSFSTPIHLTIPITVGQYTHLAKNLAEWALVLAPKPGDSLTLIRIFLCVHHSPSYSRVVDANQAL